MGTPRTLAATTVGSSTSPVPAYYDAARLVAAVSFSITNGIATIVLGAANLPTDGYNGPNGYPVQNGTTGSQLDIQGVYPAPNGQQVQLWGFTTATYFNGKTVTVLRCNPSNGSFSFYFNHANVASTNDAGNTAPCPKEQYRVVRIEVDQGNSTDFVYVGDLNVSTTQYIAALSLTGQVSIDIASENLRADRIWMVGTNSAATDKVHVSLIY